MGVPACLPAIREEDFDFWQLLFLRKWLHMREDDGSRQRFFRQHCQRLSAVSRRVLAGNMWRDRYCAHESKADRQQAMLEAIVCYEQRHFAGGRARVA